MHHLQQTGINQYGRSLHEELKLLRLSQCTVQGAVSGYGFRVQFQGAVSGYSFRVQFP
jgi:hypothetical protein